MEKKSSFKKNENYEQNLKANLLEKNDDEKFQNETKVNKSQQAVSFFKLQYAVSSPGNNVIAILALIGSLCLGFSLPLFSIIFGDTINGFTPGEDPDAFVKKISNIVLRFVYIGLATWAAGFFNIFLWSLNGKNIAYNIKKEYFKLLMKQEQRYFDHSNTFEFATKIISQVKTIENGIGDKIGNTLQAFAMLISGFCVGFIYSWKLSLVLTAMLPFLSFVGFITGKMMRSSTVKNRESYEKAGGIAEECLYNIKTINSFANFDYEIGRFTEKIEESCISGIKNVIKAAIAVSFIFFLIFASYSLAIFYGSKLIADGDWNDFKQREFQVGDVLTVLFTIVFGAMAMGQTAPNINAVNAAMCSAYDFFELMKRFPKINLSNSVKKPEKENIIGKISFNDVTFGYPIVKISNENEKDDEKDEKKDNKNKVDQIKNDKQTVVEDKDNLNESNYKLVLSDFNLEIESNKTTAIVGASGSGKSTIVSLIERLYDVDKGEILLDDENIKNIDLKYLRSLYGYVAQEPVLFNTSIRENIIFGRENISDEQIWKALDKAYAKEFVEKIEDGLDYIVGVKGSKLSGGQKQRIAIARAILLNPKILILDEATSALDNKSEKEVQKALTNISENITTIIIAHRLSTIINADKIVVLLKGKIVESGTHEELLELNGEYAGLVKNQVGQDVDQYKSDENTQENEDNEYYNIKDNNNNEIDQIKQSDRKLSQESKNTNKSNKTQKSSKSRKKTNLDLAIEEDLKIKAEKEKGYNEKVNASKKKLWTFLMKNKGVSFGGAFFALIAGGIWPTYGVLLGFAIEYLSNQDKEKVRNDGVFISIMFLIFASATLIITFFQTFLFGCIGEYLTKNLRLATFEKYLRIDMGFYDKVDNTPGNLLTRLASDTTKLNGIALSMVGIGFQTSSCIIIATVLGFFYDWRLCLINLAFMPFVIMTSAVNVKIQRGFGQIDDVIDAEAGSILSECVCNTKTIFSYNMQDTAVKIYQNILGATLKNIRKTAFVNGFMFGFGQFSMYSIYAAVFYSGSVFVSKGTLEIGDMYKAIFTILFSAFGLGQAQIYLGDIAKANQALVNIFDILDYESKVDYVQIREANKDSDIDYNQFKGKIEFKNVKFAYPTVKDKIVFKDLSFIIEPGQKAAFVGHSGCGKSTIVQLIQRFYEPLSGEILIDDINIKNYDLVKLKDKMSLVMQEPVLFIRDVSENIKYGNLSVSDSEVEEIAKKAKISHFLGKQFEEVKANISGGEKQRVAIARALLKNPKILLLDEATSALDKTSEEEVQKSLDDLMLNRTSLVIAHRLSTIEKSNVIFLMENGQIIEHGTHEDLMNKKTGYFKLYQSGQGK